MSYVDLKEAIELLNHDQIVAFPTETVYGLGARIDSESALKKIFSTKERPFFDPLIVHVDSIEQAKSCCSSWPEVVDILVEKLWPGPLSLVLPKSKRVSDLITSGLTNVGLRWPKHKVAQELIHGVGCPIAAPSANKFGRTSATEAEHIESEFHGQVAILKQEKLATTQLEFGIESTVLYVDVTSPTAKLSILRKGAVLKSEIEEALNRKSFVNYEWVESIDKKFSPGHMKHHYMPSIPFIVCKNPQMKLSELGKILNERLSQLPDQIEGVKIVKPSGAISKIEFLKLSDQAELAAREVYSKLRSASERRPEALCFIQLPQHQGEMWESVLDRLYKAASLVL